MKFKAGTTFVIPFVGRLDDIGTDGMQLIGAKLEAHVATMPPAAIKSLFSHPLTDKSLAPFAADWKKTGQSIL